MNPLPINPLLPLCQLPIGTTGRVRELVGDGDFCQRVREMGFGEFAVMTKISGTGPFVCQVNGTRIALSHAAAKQILVEAVVSSVVQGARYSPHGALGVPERIGCV